ncbi:uncharacterized protein LOC111325757 [Stylophora pistillata]|uniref:uncharacterized protein LOC111325757 n=1 Tax=Stylophora pistillata TaxID=50429 RepID=UPI000C0434B5|nr:uncharacterized protein LOC111325757 [Stylophora pistillata]
MAQVHNLQMQGVTKPEISSRNETEGKKEGSSVNLTNNRDILRGELSNKLLPILNLMKFSGEFYGDTSLSETPPATSNFISRIYCGMVLLGQITILAQAVASLVYEGFDEMKNTYTLLLFGVWYLQSVGVNITCLFALPITRKRRSRFLRFISFFLETADSGDFSGLSKWKLNAFLALTCFAALTNTTSIALLTFFEDNSIARFRPWNGRLTMRLLHVLINFYNSFAWTLPIFLFGISCSLVSGMIDGFQKKVISQVHNFPDIGSLRKEHVKLCKTVSFADKVFSPYLFVILSLHIPLICFNFHQLLKSDNSRERDTIFFFTFLYWWMGLSSQIAVIFMFGIRVHEKIHGIYDALQQIVVADCKEHLELLHFLMHLRGEPIGMSVGGLVVINKSLLLSVVGIIISYLAVLLTLPA